MSPGFGEFDAAAAISSGSDAQDPELYLNALCGLTIDEFWHAANAGSVGLGKKELARVLLAVGVKYNYGMASGVTATRTQIGAFWRSLQLLDLALAHACALGYEAAWQQFMTRYQEPLTQAAIGITGSATMGHDLADSLYSAMFGLTERDGERQSPLAYYSGRGSFKGFLRATLARLCVDYHRRTSRETPLPSGDPVAAPSAPAPFPGVLSQLGESLTATLGSLNPEKRFLLAAWFLDQRTLLETTANMVMVDLGIPPGFELLTEDLDSYRERSAGKKSGRLEKFSLTPTQAILYFDSIGPNDGLKLSFRLRAKYPIRARTFASRVYEYYDPAVSSLSRPVQLEVRKK